MEPRDTQQKEAHTSFTRAMALFQSGRAEEAEPLFRAVVRTQPNNYIALHLLGVIFLQSGRTEQGANLIARSIALFPDDPLAHRNLGYAFSLLNRPDEALESYDRAISLNPQFTNAHYNRGVCLGALGRHEQALHSFDEAIRLDVAYAEAHNNRANTLNALHRFAEALASGNMAVTLKPDFAEAYNNRGNSLVALRRFEDALKSFDHAILIDPTFGAAHGNRGNALSELKRYDEASASYERAMALCPLYADKGADGGSDPALLLGHALHARLTTCNWTGLADRLGELSDRINRGQSVSPPFPVLLACGSAAVQRRAAESYARSERCADASVFARHTPRGKVRVGYFSADFFEHATSFLMAEMFEKHDKTRFELMAFSFGPPTQDEMHKRLTRAFDTFVDVRDQSDDRIAVLAKEMEIDIAVDLKGYTAGSRPGIFARRAAPIQVNYLGYPGTMGADFMDYLIADPTLIPISEQVHYTEKIAYLPDTYQPNDTRRRISGRQFTRTEAGLPDVGFVFCCFNNSFKIMPDTFECWMRILRQVEGGVLWLLEDNSAAAENLKREATSRGIDPNRLVFAKRVAPDEHLARHRLADLFLDTLPCNAHTTASDALWSGLPVLTQLGQTFAGRVAASLLTAIDLPELITANSTDYETLAVQLASDPSNLARIRQKLAQNRSSKPLFDIERFTRNIEAAYSGMIKRHRAGLHPDHLYVAGRS